MKWQHKFIKDFISCRSPNNDTFASIINKNIQVVNTKNQYLPHSLMKFYSPTSENILDIKNKRLWIADPNSFNDPFDCKIGYDYYEFEKYTLINYILKNELKKDCQYTDCFTKDDLHDIYNTYISLPFNRWYKDRLPYFSKTREIFSLKSEQFQKEINNMLNEKRIGLNSIFKELKHTSARIASFSGLKRYDGEVKKNLMWAHYANNHQGFCVEYDISTLCQDLEYKVDWLDWHRNEEQFMKERMEATIKAGLFPVRYTNKRTNIPKTVLEQILKSTDNGNPILPNNKLEELLLKAFTTKSTVWNYEQEWRVIIDEAICKYYDYKIPFPYIKTIFIGCRASSSLEKTMIELGNELGVEVIKMKEDETNFDLFEGTIWDDIYKNNPFITY